MPQEGHPTGGWKGCAERALGTAWQAQGLTGVSKEEEMGRMCLFSLEKRRYKGLINLVKDIDSLGTASGYQLDLHWSGLTS